MPKNRRSPGRLGGLGCKSDSHFQGDCHFWVMRVYGARNDCRLGFDGRRIPYEAGVVSVYNFENMKFL